MLKVWSWTVHKSGQNIACENNKHVPITLKFRFDNPGYKHCIIQSAVIKKYQNVQSLKGNVTKFI